MVTEQGHPSGEVARELGICIDTLRSWLKMLEPRQVRQIDKVVTSSINVSWRPKIGRYASNWPRKTRSLTS